MLPFNHFIFKKQQRHSRLTRLRLVAVCFLILQVFIRLASAQTMQLNEVLNTVQQSYPSLKMYNATIQSLDAAAKGARSWMPPQVSAGFWMTPYNTSLWSGSKADGNTPAQNGMGSYMIGAAQMFPNKKYNDANEAYLKAMSAVSKENKAAALNELYAAAKKNYYDWMVLEKKLAVLADDEKLLQFMITNAETRYKNGLGKISAYYKAKASLGNIENMRVAIQNEIVQKRIALNTLMNRNQLANFTVDTNYVIKDYSTVVFDSTLFYTSRSDIQALDSSIRIARLQQDVERQSMKPQFGVQYAHMFGFGGAPAMFNIMGMVKIPVNWSTRANKANIESLRFKTQSLQEQKAAMANDYASAAYTLQQNLAAKKKQVVLYENNILAALRKNYQSTLLAYEQNTGELFELYDAWEALDSTALEYLDQLQQLLDMQVELEKLLEIK